MSMKSPLSNSSKIPNQRARDRVPPRKFSTLVKHLVVEFDRDPAQYPESNTVEVRFIVDRC